MKLLISTSSDPADLDEASLSAAAKKRTAAAQAAATKAMPKTAEALAKISAKIKVLKKKALKAYFVRKKADAAKAAKKGSKTGVKEPAGVSKAAGPAASTSSVVVISPELETYLLDRQVQMSDSDLMDCCSESAVATKTSAAEKTSKGKTLLKAAKNPKVALRKKQMAAAMRIRENKETRLEIKKLLEMKEKLQDKAWQTYLKKSAAAKKPSAAKPTTKPEIAPKPDVKPKPKTLNPVASVSDKYARTSNPKERERLGEVLDKLLDDLASRSKTARDRFNSRYAEKLSSRAKRLGSPESHDLAIHAHKRALKTAGSRALTKAYHEKQLAVHTEALASKKPKK